MRPFTLAVVMSRVPALRPWVITHDRWFEVLGGTPDLLEGIRLGIMVALHLGPPYQSFNTARVPAVRTTVFPLGLHHLTPTQSQLVERGSVSVANSERTLLWIHPDVLEFSLGSLVLCPLTWPSVLLIEVRG